MSEQQPEALRSLYEITGNVADANTVLVNRAELRCLHQMNLSNQEWLDKTEWVQATAQARELGQHRADVIKQRLDLVTGQRDELLGVLKDTMALINVLMPGVRYIPLQDYAALNETPLKARAAIAKAEGGAA